MPHKTPQRMTFVVMFARGEVLNPEQGLQVWPPHYSAQFGAEDAKFLEIRSVQPGDFNLKDDPNAPIGPAPALQVKLEAEYLTKLLAWLQAMDALMPAFVAGQAALPPNSKQTARDAQKLYEAVAEPPLKPYYAFVASSFFTWLGKVST
jgi:hypothetical protein